MIFPITIAKHHALQEIYLNPGINVRELLTKTKTSFNTLNKITKQLLASNIIYEKTIKKNNKILLKKYYPKLDTDEGLGAYSLIESENKTNFFEKHKQLKKIFENLNINAEIIIIYGSFARGTENLESDVDIFLVVKQKKDYRKELERAFAAFDHEISATTSLMQDFKKHELYEQILKNHTIIKGTTAFLKMNAKELSKEKH